MDKKLSASLALASVALLGCQLATTDPAPAVSIYGSSVPVYYGISASNNVVSSAIDRNKEGIVLSADIEEYDLPSAWAKVTSGTSSYLYNKKVYPSGLNAADFVTDGTSYWAKNIRIGTGTDAKSFAATVTGTTLAYNYPATGTATITLPNSALGYSSLKWYAEQMKAGNYEVLDSTGAAFTDLDYTKGSGALGDQAAFSGVTKGNRWLKSANDSAWKAQLKKAQAFFEGKNLSSTESLKLASKGGEWVWGDYKTGVKASWGLDSYVTVVVAAYENKSGNTSTDSGTDTGSGTTGGTDTTTGASPAE